MTIYSYLKNILDETKQIVLNDKNFSSLIFSIFFSAIFFFIGYFLFTLLPKSDPINITNVISNFTQTPASSLSSYIVIFFVFILSSIGFIFGAKISVIKLVSELSLLKNISSAVYFLMCIVTLASLILIVTYKDPSIMMFDYFHDGERLAYWSKNSAIFEIFSQGIMIHGISNNVLPLFLAQEFFGENTIAGLRLIIIAQHALTYLCIFLIIMFSIKSIGIKKVAELSLIAFIFLVLISGPLNPTSSKDFALFAFCASLFGFIAYSKQSYSYIFAFLAGFFLIFSFFYTFNRGLYGIIYFLIMSFAFLFFDKKLFISWTVTTFLSSGIALLIIINAYGIEFILDLYSQYEYWTKNAKLVWGFSLPNITSMQTLMAWIAMFSLFIIGLLSIVIFKPSQTSELLASDRLKYKLTFIALFIFAPIFSRDFIDRFYFGKIGVAALPLIILFLLILISWLKDFSFKKESMPKQNVFKFLILFITTMSLAFQASVISSSYISAANIENSELIEDDYLATISRLSYLTEDQDCFYTMTSEGVWYHFLNKPSCSTFPIVTYARSSESQKKVISQLEDNYPEYILFSNRGWSNKIEGVSVFSANSLIVSFLLKNYKPFEIIESHWIWRKREEPYIFQFSEININHDIDLSNVSINYQGQFENGFKKGVIYSFLNEIPVWVGTAYEEGSTWSAKIPEGLIDIDIQKLDIIHVDEDGIITSLLSTSNTYEQQK